MAKKSHVGVAERRFEISWKLFLRDSGIRRRILSNFSLSLSLSSNPSLYRIEDIPRGSDILLALPFEHRVRSRI